MKTKKFTVMIAILMMFAIIVASSSLTATALSGEKGSITLNLSDPKTGKPLANIPFRLYFIAKANVGESGIKYEMIPPYDKANIDTDNLQDSSVAIHLAHFATSNSQPYIEKTTDEKGILVFENLEQGLYLVVPVQNTEGSYTASPFFVSVPAYDSQNKKWEFHIDASPKILDGSGSGDNLKTYISVIKKWDTETSHPESITIVLLRDFQEYKKIELNAENNWHYRFDDLPKNHIWDVVEENVPDGYTVYYETSSNTVTIINKYEKPQEGTTKPSEGTTEDKTENRTEDKTENETEEDKLVQTGQLNWPVPVCAIAGLLIFSIGWAVLNFGKKETE